jgi:hypothetical protein
MTSLPISDIYTPTPGQINYADAKVFVSFSLKMTCRKISDINSAGVGGRGVAQDLRMTQKLPY